MQSNSYYFSGDKFKRAEYAKKHTEEMEKFYKEDIKDAVNNTRLYDFYDGVKLPNKDEVNYSEPNLFVSDMDSVKATGSFGLGRTAVLNFASYKSPGGMFLQGSKAQEECLCASSYLYNVLKEFDNGYYRYNREHLNRGLYFDRGLYTKDVQFFDANGQPSFKADVITVAAPNAKVFLKYNKGKELANSKALTDRIEMVLKIAEDNKVDNLVLGAYGCGVFGQNPYEVASNFKELLKCHYFANVAFAIPSGFHKENYDAFMEVFKDRFEDRDER